MITNVLRAIVAAIAFCALSAWAQPASTESVERLLAAAKIERLMQQMRTQQQAMIGTMLDRAMTNRTPEERAKARESAERGASIVNEELSWEKLRPIFVQVYTETFTQEEVDGLIAFYESPTGRAFVDKQPQVMARAGQLIGTRMQDVMARVMKSATSAASTSSSPSPAPAPSTSSAPLR